MARKFRTSQLNAGDQRTLREIAPVYSPGYDELINYVEQQGALPTEVASYFNQGGPGSKAVLQRLNELLGRLPSQESAYNKYLEQTKDEANLTDEELQDRISAYQGLGNVKQTRQVKRYNELNKAIADELKKKISDRGLGNLEADKAAKYLAKQLIEGQAFSIQTFAEEFLDQNPSISPETFEKLKGLGGEAHDSFVGSRNNYSGEEQFNPYNTGADIERLQGLLGDRAAKRQREAEIDEFLTTLPQELARGREDYLGTLENQALAEYGDISQDAMANLNARGLLNSGDLQSELQRSAGQAFAPVQQAAFDLAQSDADFFQNAAYQTTLRRELESGNDITNQVASARDSARTNQEQSFQRQQTKVKSDYNQGAYERQLLRQYRQQESVLKKEREQRDSANKAGLASTIGSAVGAIGGAYVTGGSPIGASIGGQIGGQTGSSVVNG